MADAPFDASRDDDPAAHPDFERLLNDYLEELNANGFVDPNQILEDHPELGPAILVDLETFIELHGPGADSRPQPLGTLGDYTLRRLIGRGGMGVVYDAWQNSLDRPVALKVLPAGIAADDKMFHRFMREAKTTAKLNHPNIVGVYGVGIEQNTPYYAMEMVDGETLAQMLAKIKDAEPETETPFGKGARPILLTSSGRQPHRSCLDAGRAGSSVGSTSFKPLFPSRMAICHKRADSDNITHLK